MVVGFYYFIATSLLAPVAALEGPGDQPVAPQEAEEVREEVGTVCEGQEVEGGGEVGGEGGGEGGGAGGGDGGGEGGDGAGDSGGDEAEGGGEGGGSGDVYWSGDEKDWVNERAALSTESARRFANAAGVLNVVPANLKMEHLSDPLQVRFVHAKVACVPAVYWRPVARGEEWYVRAGDILSFQYSNHPSHKRQDEFLVVCVMMFAPTATGWGEAKIGSVEKTIVTVRLCGLEKQVGSDLTSIDYTKVQFEAFRFDWINTGRLKWLYDWKTNTPHGPLCRRAAHLFNRLRMDDTRAFPLSHVRKGQEPAPWVGVMGGPGKRYPFYQSDAALERLALGLEAEQEKAKQAERAKKGKGAAKEEEESAGIGVGTVKRKGLKVKNTARTGRGAQGRGRGRGRGGRGVGGEEERDEPHPRKRFKSCPPAVAGASEIQKGLDAVSERLDAFKLAERANIRATMERQEFLVEVRKQVREATDTRSTNVDKTVASLQQTMERFQPSHDLQKFKDDVKSHVDHLVNIQGQFGTTLFERLGRVEEGYRTQQEAQRARMDALDGRIQQLESTLLEGQRTIAREVQSWIAQMYFTQQRSAGSGGGDSSSSAEPPSQPGLSTPSPAAAPPSRTPAATTPTPAPVESSDISSIFTRTPDPPSTARSTRRNGGKS